MGLIHGIHSGIEGNVPHHEIARKIFLTYPTHAFIGDEERQYVILNEIACFFKVPIMSVQIAGSAKTGRSFHTGTEFIKGDSDLDVAIIDSRLFSYYMELVFVATSGYSDLSKFPKRDGSSQFNSYIKYLGKGLFRPDLMPYGQDRAKVNNFFGNLSSKHGDLFSSINAAVYLSQSFFEVKQKAAISKISEKGFL